MSRPAKDNTGALFANNDRPSDTHPHAKGSALIAGVEYWVSAWTNYAQDGTKYQSLSFTRKVESQAITEAGRKEFVDGLTRETQA